jgi:hypothetical protein
LNDIITQRKGTQILLFRCPKGKVKKKTRKMNY